MIYLKKNPVGIDVEIQKVQQYLYDKLNWDIEAYGRAEINNNEPVVFFNKNDYKNVLLFNQKKMGEMLLFDDKVFFSNKKTSGKMFFFDSQNTFYNRPYLKTNIDVIFILNIKEIKPLITHRADEEVRIEILNHLQNKFKEIKIIKGIEALNGFSTKLENLHPYHFLKFSFEVNYQNNC